MRCRNGDPGAEASGSVTSLHTITILASPEARVRLDAARAFVEPDAATNEVLLVGETREAADDLARDVAQSLGATFGLHRFSLSQLASKIAAVELARAGLAPATRLSAEAVATRAAFEELGQDTLGYLAPIARLRTFGRTLAATLKDLRHADVGIDRVSRLGEGGPDLGALAGGYARQLEQARLVDSAELCRMAATAATRGDPGLSLDGPLVLLDVAVRDEATLELVAALAARASRVLATTPAGDDRTLAALRRLPGAVEAPRAAGSGTTDDLARVRRYLFEPADVPATEPRAASPDVHFFSAPGEGRECVEIARAILQEVARGVTLDRIAVLLRAPGVYAGLLETALTRAGIRAWFVRGTRAPDPAGRAFLALLACAAERLSARRFSEYLSLGQVPLLDGDGAPPVDRARWVPPDSAAQVLPAPALPAQLSLLDVLHEADGVAADDNDAAPVLAGTLRAPWRWDHLLVESAVIGGRDRWARRLDGLARELELKREEHATEDPDSARVRAIGHDLRNLDHLRRFALPVIDQLAAFPERTRWGQWLDLLERLAPMVLEQPDRVLGVLGELRPMARVGPVPLLEVQDVLRERLAELQAEPPPRRFGRVFVGGPDHARGRSFAVVFVPGLAERIFPQKQRQDPLLLDELRRDLNRGGRPSAGGTRSTARPTPTAERLGLPVLDDRAAHERLLLRLAVGAATERLYLSYPRLHVSEARPRVPSFYALDIDRARSGRVPDFRAVEHEAFQHVEARLAWPAPATAELAVDDTEHDLAVLGRLLRREVTRELKGRARYLLRLNPGLRRSLLTRWARWKHPWSKYDGLYDLGDETRTTLAAYRLNARPYSVSSLQRFAMCPYQFLLAAIYRLEPRPEIESLERLDPLTRGRMFHAVQAEFMRELQRRDALPVTPARVNEAETALDATLDRVAAAYKEDLAPAIDRVWQDEVESMRADLKGWLHHVANEDGEWIPIRAEFGFGFAPGGGRDPESVPEPVRIDGQWRLHGVVDLIEARSGPTPTGELRVTDHKTGKNRTRERMIVGHGEVLQPVLYGLAVERTLGRPVGESRLFFCTSTGAFGKRPVTLGDAERRHGVEVLEVIDRAIEGGALLPAPRERACRWCDFREVCGPWEETRVKKKDETKLVDLYALRRLP